MPKINVHRNLILHLPGGVQVPLNKGEHDVEAQVAEHWFVQANATVLAAAPAPTPAVDPEAEKKAAEAAAKAEAEKKAAEAKASNDAAAKADAEKKK